MKRFASIVSIGAYAPPKILTNADLEKMVDTSDEWILKRTGIRERRIAADNEAASDLGVCAAKIALERANRRIEDIDLIILASLSGDFHSMPSTACVLAGKLGAKNTPAFDLLAACSGFIYALSAAKAYIESGMAESVLLVGAEAASRFIDYSDRSTCVLFGDGAGACVLAATDDPKKAVIDVEIASNGKKWDFLTIDGGSRSTIQSGGAPYIKMKGHETFKIAVRIISASAAAICKKNGVTSEEIDHFIPHQANERIIRAVGTALGIGEERIVLTVDRYGNTSAASIPMAINHIYEEKRLKTGDLMLLDAFGGGLTWGSALARFAG
ncbi:MAG: ketoacyl-ACP synthase III [Helicobacteraceae bacterium]|jgi:3-oxoacyl-[acyl-carrier-protein] synthase-3|nr:ketoacyl-ACP synthase III [Helicobacteraceae bacterium]